MWEPAATLLPLPCWTVVPGLSACLTCRVASRGPWPQFLQSCDGSGWKEKTVEGASRRTGARVLKQVITRLTVTAVQLQPQKFYLRFFEDLTAVFLFVFSIIRCRFFLLPWGCTAKHKVLPAVSGLMKSIRRVVPFRFLLVWPSCAPSHALSSG